MSYDSVPCAIYIHRERCERAGERHWRRLGLERNSRYSDIICSPRVRSECSESTPFQEVGIQTTKTKQTYSTYCPTPIFGKVYLGSWVVVHGMFMDCVNEYEWFRRGRGYLDCSLDCPFSVSLLSLYCPFIVPLLLPSLLLYCSFIVPLLSLYCFPYCPSTWWFGSCI